MSSKLLRTILRILILNCIWHFTVYIQIKRAVEKIYVNCRQRLYSLTMEQCSRVMHQNNKLNISTDDLEHDNDAFVRTLETSPFQKRSINTISSRTWMSYAMSPRGPIDYCQWITPKITVTMITSRPRLPQVPPKCFEISTGTVD